MGIERRIFGLQGGGFGAFIGSSVVCLIAILTYKASSISKILYYCMFPFMLMALIIHQTRAWYMSIIVAILFFLIKSGRKMRKRAFFFTVFASGLAIGILFNSNFFGLTSRSNISMVEKTSFQLGLSADQSTGTGKFISGLSRLYVWIKGYNIFKEQPILGYGDANLRFRNMLTAQLGDPSNPNNGFVDSEFLNILYETGIVGFATWIFFLVCVFRACSQLLSLSSDSEWKMISLFISSSFIIFFVGGFFWCTTVTHEMIVYQGFLLGLLFASLRILETETKRKQAKKCINPDNM